LAPLVMSTNEPVAARALSARLTALPPSGTLAVGEQVKALRAQGRTIFNLSGGAPDPAAPVALAGIAAITADENRLGDPHGELPLRQAFAQRLARVHDVVRSGESEMVVTVGAKQGVYFALLALIEPGDEVIVIDPCWVTYAPSVGLAGGRAVPVPLGPEDMLDVAAIRAALTSRTRALLINTPHNPTGRVFSEAELSALVAFVRERDLWLICDESFDLFVFDGRRHLSPGAFDVVREQTILLYSFSKAFALPSARIGMLVAPEAVARLVANATQQIITSVALASQKLAYMALQKESDWAPLLRRAYQEKRDACLALLETEPRLMTRVPEGTFYLFPDVSRIGLGGAALTRHLLAQAGVAVTSGDAFGAAGQGHIRINLVGPLPGILAGTRKLLEALPS
jgi:aspartate/methionine/tyrosine aminotransferase